jgi:uncharacterized protein (TIGR02118 family)
MSVTLIVMYTQPSDATAFEDHYARVHVPLVDKIPGLERWSSKQVVAAPDDGELTYSRIAELHFPSEEALQAGMGSPEGQAAAADYGQIAPPGSRMFVAVS